MLGVLVAASESLTKAHLGKGYFEGSVRDGRKAPTGRKQREVNALVSVCGWAYGCVCTRAKGLQN